MSQIVVIQLPHLNWVDTPVLGLHSSAWGGSSPIILAGWLDSLLLNKAR